MSERQRQFYSQFIRRMKVELEGDECFTFEEKQQSAPQPNFGCNLKKEEPSA